MGDRFTRSAQLIIFSNATCGSAHPAPRAGGARHFGDMRQEGYAQSYLGATCCEVDPDSAMLRPARSRFRTPIEPFGESIVPTAPGVAFHP
jgi:hypothetical protein